MIKVNTGDYLSETKFYLNKVKSGETIVIMHKNKSFVQLKPFKENVKKPRWQTAELKKIEKLANQKGKTLESVAAAKNYIDSL